MKLRKKINWLDHLIGLLVVIFGITIAFYLNNWNEGRQTKRQEQKILNSLLTELGEDSINLQHLIDTTLYMEKKSSMLIKVFEDSNAVSKDSLFFYLLPLYSYFKFSPRNVTYNSMIFSGKLDIISDFELSKDIISLYNSKYDEVATVDELHRVEVFDLKIHYLHSKIVIGKNLNLTHAIIKETSFQNYAYGTNYFFRNKKNAYGEAYRECLMLIKKIESKLRDL